MSESGETVEAQPVVKRAGLALAFLAILAALQGSDPNIASTALVGAARGLDMTSTSLAASVSTLALAATAISTGLLADALGRRRVLQGALVVTAIGDLLVVLAPGVPAYLTGRAIAGAGLGAVYGAAFAYIRAVSKPGKLAAAMGAFTAMLMVGTLVFTFMGGALSQIDWRTAFLVIPVASVAGALLVPLVLPVQPRLTIESKDVVGQLLLGLGIVATLGGIGGLGRRGALPFAVAIIVLGVVLLAAWYAWEARNERAFFPIAILKNPLFLAAVLAGFVFNFGNAVIFLQVTDLWQFVTGLNTLEVSLWQLPLLLAGIASGLGIGWMMSRGLPAGTVIILGGIVAAAGLVMLALARGSTSLWAFLPGLVLGGAGIIIAAVPYGSLILQVAPPAYFGPVSGSRLTIGQFFYATGFAVSTIVIDRLTAGGTVERLEAAGVPASQVGTGLDAVTAFAAQSTLPTTSLGRQALAAATESYVSAFAVMMLVTAGLVLVASVLGFLLLRRQSPALD